MKERTCTHQLRLFVLSLVRPTPRLTSPCPTKLPPAAYLKLTSPASFYSLFRSPLSCVSSYFALPKTPAPLPSPPLPFFTSSLTLLQHRLPHHASLSFLHSFSLTLPQPSLTVVHFSNPTSAFLPHLHYLTVFQFHSPWLTKSASSSLPHPTTASPNIPQRTFINHTNKQTILQQSV